MPANGSNTGGISARSAASPPRIFPGRRRSAAGWPVPRSGRATMSNLNPGKHRRITIWQRDTAKALRAELIAKLGGRCVDCGRTDDLGFDHRAPRTWKTRDLNRWQRMKKYLEEAGRGEIELRCRRCNAPKGEPQAGGETGGAR